MITTSRSNPLDNDRLYVTREDAAGDPLGYITVAQLQTRIGTPFDLHDDVSSVLVVLDSADRVLVSDESESGDPNEYMTARNFFNGLRDVTNNDLDHNAVPNDSDRLFISDESVSADPVEYITVAELRTAIGGGGTTLSIAGLPEESSSDLADVDIMVIENVSESNIQRHLTMGSLSAFLADGTTITSAGGKLTAVGGGGGSDGVLDGGSYTGGTLTLERSVGADVTVTGLTEPFDLHDDVTTSITAMAANDRLLISDEGAAGDPNVWINFRNLLNSLRGITSSNNATPQGVDRLFITDESESGDPVEYITIDALRTAIGGSGAADGVVDGGSVAGTTLTLTRTVGADIAITGLPENALLILDENVTLHPTATSLDFAGAGVTCEITFATGVTCTIPGGGGAATVSLSTTCPSKPNYWQRMTAFRCLMSPRVATRTNTSPPLISSAPFGDVVNTNRTTPLDNDRMYVTREDAAGDPLGYITVAQLRTRLAGDDATLSIAGLPNQASTQLADTDIMVIENVSESNVQRHLTMGSLSAFLADETTITSAGGKLTAVADGVIDGGAVGAAGTLTISRTVGADIVITGLTEPFDLHDDVPNGNSTPHPLDRLVSSDESASGDPNEWLTIRDILDEMADSASTRLPSPVDADRFFVSDVSAGGRPLRFIETSELRAAIVTESSVEDVLFTDVEAIPDIAVGTTDASKFHSTGFTGWTGKTLITFNTGYHINTGAAAREIVTITMFVAHLTDLPQTASADATVVDSPGVAQNAISFSYTDRASEGNGESTGLHGVLKISFGRTGAGELLVATESNSSAFISAKAVAY